MAESHPVATPYLFIKGAARAIEFYQAAFNATLGLVIPMGDGAIGHAEMTIFGAHVMLSDESPDFHAISPSTLNGTPVLIYIHAPDVDELAARAASHGAEILQPPADQFYGRRTVKIRDPFGHQWAFVKVIEELTDEQIERRAKELFG